MIAYVAVKRFGVHISSLLLLMSCAQSSPFVDRATDSTVPDGQINDIPDVATVAPDEGTADSGPSVDDTSQVKPTGASVQVGTWNLHNFSKYGDGEFRTGDIAAKIIELNVDVLAVQELKVKEGTDGSAPQAWDKLLELLPGYEGIHAPWKLKDSAVGLLFNKDRVTLNDWKYIFPNEWSAFPRPPVEAHLTINHDGKSSYLRVIVLHLKAFKDSVDRRREACKLLSQYIAEQDERRYIVIGDFNDDPYDSASNNSYEGTFLNAEPKYHFITKALPKGTVTSLGYYTWVDGQKMDGEFLDHAVVTGELYDEYSSITAEVRGVNPSQWSAWEKSLSDHFPVVVQLKP